MIEGVYMLSEMSEVLVSSFFGNGYVTLPGAEIKDYISKTCHCSKKALTDMLRQRGYTTDEITAELNRQCSCSVLRFLPSRSTYTSTDIGTALWEDICNRIGDQPSIVAGNLQCKGSKIKIDIYRTDFQPTELKKKIKNLQLHQAPVMRWTGQFQMKDTLQCVDHLIEAVPFTGYHRRGDLSSVLQIAGEIVRRKPKKTPWAWLVFHPVVQVELTPSKKKVLKKLFKLSNGPVDWKGTPVSLDELLINTDLLYEEIEESIEYLKKHGIVRIIDSSNGDLTPTGQGYVLLRHAFRPCPSVTFAVTRNAETEYQLEVSTPSYLTRSIQDLLKEQGGTVLSEFQTPAVFSSRERSQICAVFDVIIKALSEPGLRAVDVL